MNQLKILKNKLECGNCHLILDDGLFANGGTAKRRGRQRCCRSCCVVYRKSHKQKCLDCNTRIEKTAKRCKPCASRKLSGAAHPGWKGGKYKTSYGYIRVLFPDHPRADMNGYVLEHIVVMANYLGRDLFDGETVHHKNGVRDDNRLENLELWSNSHPSGQRVRDKIIWAQELLQTYKAFKVI